MRLPEAKSHLSIIDEAVDFIDEIGVGAMVVSDKVGENTNTQFTTSFAYKLPINAGTTLSFGIQAGFVNYKTDPSQLSFMTKPIRLLRHLVR